MMTRSIARRHIAPTLAVVALVLAALVGLPASPAHATGTWATQASGYEDLYSVACTGAATAWAVGQDGLIFATTDGGAHWTAQNSSTNKYLYSVACTDTTHAIAVGVGGIVATTNDGGAHWTSQNLMTPDLSSVTCTETSHGWAVGAEGTILATTDGGAHWVAQTSGTQESLTSVAFSDATHGWAVGLDGTILATTDGGAHWVAQTSGTLRTLDSVAFSDAAHGWAVGANGTILATTDGGAHWVAQTSAGTTDQLLSVAFSDAAHGWAVGAFGEIFAMTDGGTDWAAQTSPTAVWLRSVAFSDAGHGWAVGQGGTIIAYNGSGSGDTTAPTTTSSFNPPAGAVFSANQPVELTPTDNSGGSGVKATYYKIDSGTFTSGTSFTVTGDGLHTFSYYSVDNANNSENVHTSNQFRIDTIKPVTTCDAVGGQTYTGAQTFTLTPTDTNGSGVVDGTYWQLDSTLGGAWTNGTSVPVAAPVSGSVSHTLYFHSRDVAGNIEDMKQVTFSVEAGPAQTWLPVWRFYDTRTGAHFYTADPTEKASVERELSKAYRPEGVCFEINTANAANSMPLWRFYDTKTGTHFYTADVNEKNHIMTDPTSKAIYRPEGVAFNVSTTTGEPVWRFLNIQTGAHFYTADPTEKANTTKNFPNVYRLEGVGFYIGQ